MEANVATLLIDAWESGNPRMHKRAIAELLGDPPKRKVALSGLIDEIKRSDIKRATLIGTIFFTLAPLVEASGSSDLSRALIDLFERDFSEDKLVELRKQQSRPKRELPTEARREERWLCTLMRALAVSETVEGNVLVGRIKEMMKGTTLGEMLPPNV